MDWLWAYPILKHMDIVTFTLLSICFYGEVKCRSPASWRGRFHRATLSGTSIILRYNQHTLSWAMHEEKEEATVFVKFITTTTMTAVSPAPLQLHAQAPHMTLIFHVWGIWSPWLLIWLHTSLNKNSGLSCWIFHQIFPLWLLYISPSHSKWNSRAFIQRICHFKINLSPTCTSLPLPLFHLSFKWFYHKISYTAQ